MTLALALPMNADVCVKCIARECVSGLTSGYVNCGSNGNKCIQWDSCVSGVSTEPAPARQWTLARVDVRPAPRQDEVRWRLARVEVAPR